MSRRKRSLHRSWRLSSTQQQCSSGKSTVRSMLTSLASKSSLTFSIQGHKRPSLQLKRDVYRKQLRLWSLARLCLTRLACEKEKHPLYVFKSLSHTDKLELLHAKNCCLNCLCPGHTLYCEKMQVAESL